MGRRLTTVTCILVACCVYIRHRQVSQWQLERGNDLVSKRIVVVTAWCGVLACFGLDILANFQEARVVGAHMIGAMTCFTAGTIYFCLQVRDSAEINLPLPPLPPERVFNARTHWVELEESSIEIEKLEKFETF